MRTIFPIELIKWVDSCNVGEGWYEWDDEDICQYHVVTAGFVRHEDDDVIAIVMSIPFDTTDMVNGQTLIIPKCCIKERKVLKK